MRDRKTKSRTTWSYVKNEKIAAFWVEIWWYIVKLRRHFIGLLKVPSGWYYPSRWCRIVKQIKMLDRPIKPTPMINYIKPYLTRHLEGLRLVNKMLYVIFTCEYYPCIHNLDLLIFIRRRIVLSQFSVHFLTPRFLISILRWFGACLATRQFSERMARCVPVSAHCRLPVDSCI